MSQKFTRRRFVQSTGALGAGLALQSLQHAAAQDDPLYQAAKKEGKLSLYWGSYEQKTAEEFRDAFKAKYPGIQLISSDQYAGPTRDTAKRASENLLNRFADEIQGIFTPNESLRPVLNQLKSQGYRLVLLSNTTIWHFEFVRERFDVDVCRESRWEIRSSSCAFCLS